eukprot:scaffold625_cov202-Alexandrium_tamarense.AAC.21
MVQPTNNFVSPSKRMQSSIYLTVVLLLLLTLTAVNVVNGVNEDEADSTNAASSNGASIIDDERDARRYSQIDDPPPSKASSLRGASITNEQSIHKKLQDLIQSSSSSFGYDNVANNLFGEENHKQYYDDAFMMVWGDEEDGRYKEFDSTSEISSFYDTVEYRQFEQQGQWQRGRQRRDEYLSQSSLQDDNNNSSNNNWYEQWQSLSPQELIMLSYDSSSLDHESHHVLGSLYVGRRRTSVSVADDSRGLGGRGTRGRSIGVPTSFLRGNTDRQHQRQETEGDRNLQSWTMHGPENQPLPGDPGFVPLSTTGLSTTGGSGTASGALNNNGVTLESNINPPAVSIVEGIMNGDVQDVASSYSKPQPLDKPMTFYDIGTSPNNNARPIVDDEETQKLYNRLKEAVEVTKSLNAKHKVYDTNSEYSYSNPGGVNITNEMPDGSATNEEGDTLSQMTHTLSSARQRLLTGNYAAWQWYDRSNLASPSNLKLSKVSRINYAFFQTDSEGYIFGTDSWADPNVLFGSYDFSVSVDRLPAECRGGRGRNDGTPKNVTDDGGKGGGAASANRRMQNGGNNNGGDNKYKYPDFTQDPPCKNFEQCHRNFPNSKSCNIHNYEEGLIYIAHTNGAQIYPSIGGWTLSGSFPTVAADPAKRKRFAQECVGLIADYGFDGIDIDWEVSRCG